MAADSRHSDKIRFLVGGASNTLLSYAVYLLLQMFMEYRLAYSMAFIFGIFSGYAINTLFVFRTNWRWKTLFAYPLVPLASYATSLAIVHVAVERIGIDRRIAPLVATAIMLPLTYATTRWIVDRKSD